MGPHHEPCAAQCLSDTDWTPAVAAHLREQHPGRRHADKRQGPRGPGLDQEARTRSSQRCRSATSSIETEWPIG